MPNPPKPSALRKLTGSNMHRLNKREAIFRSVDTVVPLKVVERDPIALEEWNRVVPELVMNGLLTRANLSLFGAYCCAYAAWMHAENEVFENGRWLNEPVFNKNGDQVAYKRKPNPFLKQAQQARVETRLHAAEFGLTPASATRVMADPNQEQKGTFGQFINQDDDDEQDAVN